MRTRFGSDKTQFKYFFFPPTNQNLNFHSVDKHKHLEAIFPVGCGIEWNFVLNTAFTVTFSDGGFLLSTEDIQMSSSTVIFSTHLGSVCWSTEQTLHLLQDSLGSEDLLHRSGLIHFHAELLHLEGSSHLDTDLPLEHSSQQGPSRE